MAKDDSRHVWRSSSRKETQGKSSGMYGKKQCDNCKKNVNVLSDGQLSKHKIRKGGKWGWCQGK